MKFKRHTQRILGLLVRLPPTRLQSPSHDILAFSTLEPKLFTGLSIQPPTDVMFIPSSELSQRLNSRYLVTVPVSSLGRLGKVQRVGQGQYPFHSGCSEGLTGDQNVGLVQWSEENSCTVKEEGGREVVGVCEVVWEGAPLEFGQKEDGLGIDRPLYGGVSLSIILMFSQEESNIRKYC